MNVDEIAELRRAALEGAERFRTLAEGLPHLVWLSNPDGRITYFNQRWTDYTGVGVDDLRAGGRKGAVHDDDIAKTWTLWSRALETQQPYEIEYRLKRASDGSFRWFIARAVPVFGPGGEIVQWIGTATDIDAQKRAHENLRFVLEGSNAFAAALDEETIYRRLGQLATANFADWCIIVAKRGDSEYRVASIAHADPQRVRYVEQYRDRYPIRAEGELARVMRENVAHLEPTIDAKLVEAAATDAEHLEVLQSLAMHSAMLVPISTPDGTVYGGAVFFSSESGRRYDPIDLDVARTVAQRAAVAIANAAVFQAERRTAKILRFVSKATELLFESFDLPSVFERVALHAVKEIADVAFVVRVDRDRSLRNVVAAGNTEARALHARHLVGERTARPDAEPILYDRLVSGATYLTRDYDVKAHAAHFWDYVAPHVISLNVTSIIVIPLVLRGELYGAFSFCTADDTPQFSERDRELLSDLARRATVAIGQAETFARERRIATELQRAMLPPTGSLPNEPGLACSAYYRSSSKEADVGGDWYDAFTLPDGSIVLSMGDIAGRGLEAAGLMGKLRQAVAMTTLYERDPSRILDAVDEMLRARRSQSIATAFVGIIDPYRRTIRYATAGHPNPLLKRHGDIVELRSSGLPLGLRDLMPGRSNEIALEGAELLVLYTDGLVEATHNIIAGEQRLRRVLSMQAPVYSRDAAEFICDACIGMDAIDDTAVMTVVFGRTQSWSFDAENAQAAHDARGEFSAYVARIASGGDAMGAELIFGELVGNVVRHAPGPIEIHLEWGGRYPVLHVTDRGAGFDRIAALPEDVMMESGRGLFIIESLARSVLVEHVDGYGTHVAVELPIERDL